MFLFKFYEKTTTTLYIKRKSGNLVHFKTMATLNNSAKKLLSKLYYNVEEKTAFTGKKQILAAAQKLDKSITKEQVDRWFATEITPTVWKPSKRAARNPYIQVINIIAFCAFYWC